MSALLASLAGCAMVFCFLLVLHWTLPSLQSEPRTRAELTTQVLLDRAREAYLAGEVEVDEFEARVADALRGGGPFYGPYSDSRPANLRALDAALKSQYQGPILTHEELKATDAWFSTIARTLEDAIAEGKAVGPREHAPRVLVEADMDRKIAEL